MAIQFKGAYDESYTDGDNRGVLPTDTMKNTVYALAAEGLITDPEPFALRLARHFLEGNPRLTRVTIEITEHLWARIRNGDRERDHAFVRTGPDVRTARLRAGRQRTTLCSGVADLLVMKTAGSAFDRFLTDEYTTLPETRDRLLATALTATWCYREPELDFGPTWHAARRILLDTFADHRSESVQHTLHAMGEAVLDAIGEITAIRLVMPNKHHLPFDLSRFGLQNRNEIFVPTDEPHGLIEATITR